MRRSITVVTLVTGIPPQMLSSVGPPFRPMSCSGHPEPKFGGVWKKFPRANPKRISETSVDDKTQVPPTATACERHKAEPNVSLREPSARPGRNEGWNKFVSEKE